MRCVVCFQGLLDHMKSFSDIVKILLTKDGDMHIVCASGMTDIGVVFPSFDVLLDEGITQATQYVPLCVTLCRLVVCC